MFIAIQWGVDLVESGNLCLREAIFRPVRRTEENVRVEVTIVRLGDNTVLHSVELIALIESFCGNNVPEIR